MANFDRPSIDWFGVVRDECGEVDEEWDWEIETEHEKKSAFRLGENLDYLRWGDFAIQENEEILGDEIGEIIGFFCWDFGEGILSPEEEHEREG